MPSGPNPVYAAAEAALTELDLGEMKSAIVLAFPDKQALYGLLLSQWGVRADDVIYTGQAGAKAVAALIDWAKGEGRALDLLWLAWSEKRREQVALQVLVDRFLTASVEADRRDFDRRSSFDQSANRGLEAIVERGTASGEQVFGKAALEKTRNFAPEDMQHIQGLADAICMIEIGSSIRATGFLIGRRAILTVHYAVAEALRQGMTGNQIKLYFDRREGLAETMLHAAPDHSWMGVYRAGSQTDIDGHGNAVPNGLDFAVIFAERPVAATRTALTLPAQVPIISAPGDPIVVAQHPHAGPLDIAMGHVIGYSDNGERLNYVANTAPGSGGAPVLSIDGNLIAIHHAAQMDGENRVAQGVPIWPIRQAIVAAGYRLDAL